MASGIAKQYPGTPKKCRDFTDGTKVCMSQKGWSIFYATGTERYGAGFEKKAMPKKSVQESLEEEDLITWYLRSNKHE